MNIVLNILVGVQVLSAIAMVGLILMQHGKGADMGAAFGSGSAGSLFGSSGSANFLSHATAVLATIFFASTLMLAYFSHAQPAAGGDSLLERAAAVAPAPPVAPAVPVAPAASQIPTDQAPATPGATPAPKPEAPVAPVEGAAQIPGK